MSGDRCDFASFRYGYDYTRMARGINEMLFPRCNIARLGRLIFT
jgi:hypothetical protein